MLPLLNISGINMIYYDEMERDALNRDIPIMQKQGILFVINQLNEIHAHSLIEIGSAIGYSSLMMASNVNDLFIDTIELNADRYNEALDNIHHYHYDDKIHIHLDNALTFDCGKLNCESYDCLFIDGPKAQYQKFFEKYVPYVKEDGIIIVDNLDFHGMVYNIENIKNRNTRQLVRKIKRFKDWITSHPDYETTYYHIGDGIYVIRRKLL